MEERREVVRKCIACGLKQDRGNQIRILLDHITGQYIVGPTRKQFGKSIYICQKTQCIDKLSKHKRYKTKLDLSLIYDYCGQN